MIKRCHTYINIFTVKYISKKKREIKMQKVWELYAIATEIINKLCQNKCIHLGANIVEECYDYIRMRLEKDEFQALKNYDSNHDKKAKGDSYLYLLVSCRLIDFFNSSKHQREISSVSSISNRSESEEELQADVSEIIEELLEELNYEEQTYLKLCYTDEYSHKEIDEMFPYATSKASKKLENIRIKLKRKLEKAGLTLEDII
jgi:RNA polymerase sigma factor (sigma-70 family)